ncbi:MAG: hypothetical protein WC661_13235 [Opitutaceae bacterium]
MNPAQLPSSTWAVLISGQGCPEFEFLALKITLGNFRQRLQAQTATEADLRRELAAFFAQYKDTPVAQRDWGRIVNIGGVRPGTLCTVEQTAGKIHGGSILVLAGEEALLARLPEGNWIGGTIPYFMTAGGGCLCTDRIFVTELPDFVTDVQVRTYGAEELAAIYRRDDRDPISLLILPYGTAVHQSFALNAPNYPGFATHPVIGWVAGTQLGAAGGPSCFCGGPAALSDRAVELRFYLPKKRHARIDVINLFEPGGGDCLRFPTGGFIVKDVAVNGVTRAFADYLKETGGDLRLPLVADYCNTLVNVSIKQVRPETGEVEFFAPVWADVEYRQAVPVSDYVKSFETRLNAIPAGQIVFSCNCVLNYLYSNLEGRRTGSVVGPMTFGEIAYQLLNQTLVYLMIEESRVIDSSLAPSNAAPKTAGS